MSEPEIPDQSIKYSIPYAWGTLRVTNEADATYGLIPLTPEAVAGDIVTRKADDYRSSRLEIRLAGPQELNQLGDMVGVSQWAGGVVMAKVDDEALKLTIGFVVGAEELAAPLIESSHIDDAGNDVVPQILAHELAREIGTATASNITASENEKLNRRLRRQVRRSGRIAIASTGTIVALDATIGDISPFTMALLGTAIISQAVVYSRIRRRAKVIEADMRPAHFITGLRLGAIAARDVHASYCRNVFDANYGE